MKSIMLTAASSGAYASLVPAYPLAVLVGVLILAVWLYATGRAFQWVCPSVMHSPQAMRSSLCRRAHCPTPRTPGILKATRS
jgi:hypothetical protein